MKKWLIGGTLAVLGAPLILYLLLPWVIRPFLEAKLASFGCENSRVTLQAIRADRARIKEIYCLLPGRGEIRLHGIEITYSLSELYSGRLGRIFVKEARALAFEREPKKIESIPLPQSFFSFMPLSELEMPEIELLYSRAAAPPLKLKGSLLVSFHALSSSGQLQVRSDPPELDIVGEFSLSASTAELLFEKGKILFSGFQILLPEKTKLQMENESDGMKLAFSKEVLVTALEKKKEFHLHGVKAAISEHEARLGFDAVYLDLPRIASQLHWWPQKSEFGFRFGPTTFPLSQAVPTALELMEGKKPNIQVEAGELSFSIEGKASLEPLALLSAKADGELKGVGGSYGEHKFAEGHLPFRAAFSSGRFAMEPTDLSIGEFNPGVPIKSIRAKVGFDAKGEERRLRLEKASAEVFSGQVLVPELSLNAGRLHSKFLVELQGLNLGEVIALQKQAGLSGSGIVDGTLPFELSKAGITVKGGRLKARPPGGFISYDAGESMRATAAGNPGLKLAVDVLDNFQYQVLDGKVDYQISGDMDIALRLEGHNPNWSGGRPVHFNFTVSENLPKLLKSLRIADDTGEALEKRMQER